MSNKAADTGALKTDGSNMDGLKMSNPSGQLAESMGEQNPISGASVTEEGEMGKGDGSGIGLIVKLIAGGGMAGLLTGII